MKQWLSSVDSEGVRGYDVVFLVTFFFIPLWTVMGVFGFYLGRAGCF